MCAAPPDCVVSLLLQLCGSRVAAFRVCSRWILQYPVYALRAAATIGLGRVIKKLLKCLS